jgi:hypothetical protein
MPRHSEDGLFRAKPALECLNRGTRNPVGVKITNFLAVMGPWGRGNECGNQRRYLEGLWNHFKIYIDFRGSGGVPNTPFKLIPHEEKPWSGDYEHVIQGSIGKFLRCRIKYDPPNETKHLKIQIT